MELQHRPRTGDEPTHARSPLRMRLALAFAGLGNGLLGVGIFGFWLRTLPFLVFFAGLALLALGNIVVVLVRIRQGAHYQPGRDVPPYHPLDPAPQPPPPPPRRATPRRRYVRYLAIMGTCVLLIVLAWTWIRFYSVTAAVVMSIVASVLPPLAAVVTNADSPILRDDADSAPSDEYFGDGPPPEWFDQDPPGGGPSRD